MFKNWSGKYLHTQKKHDDYRLRFENALDLRNPNRQKMDLRT